MEGNCRINGEKQNTPLYRKLAEDDQVETFLTKEEGDKIGIIYIQFDDEFEDRQEKCRYFTEKMREMGDGQGEHPELTEHSCFTFAPLPVE